MIYLGDLRTGSTHYFNFTTNDKNGGKATYTEGSVKVFKDDTTAGVATGITVNKDFGNPAMTGIHNVKLVLTDSFYAAGHDYSVVLTEADIDGETVNAVLATFSIENRFAGSSLFQKAAKVLVNKAVQNKNTGEIDYYDDDSETIILTHTPTDEELIITRTPS
jgi:hypothetical protein